MNIAAERFTEFSTDLEVSRLDRIEKRAKAYFAAGRRKADLTRLVRAARLETKANARMIKILTREIEAYAPVPRR